MLNSKLKMPFAMQVINELSALVIVYFFPLSRLLAKKIIHFFRGGKCKNTNE